jgi:glycosyltransferase involved in cell wall biosynthesis
MTMIESRPTATQRDAAALPSAKPLTISVVTVCFDAAETIETTLRSVLSQSWPHVEYIVIDGGSTDGTMDIVRRHATGIARIVSEKDNGIYDAMNKGIALSTGDVVYFLNADDSFVDDRVLDDIARAFAEDERRLLVYGNVIYEGAPTGVVYERATPFATFGVHEFLRKPFCHQAVFARRELFADAENFDTRFRYVADYEWYIKVFKRHPDGLFAIDRDIARYFYRGRSTTDGANTRREKRAVWYRHLRSPALFWYDFRYMLLRGWKKKIMGQPW